MCFSASLALTAIVYQKCGYTKQDNSHFPAFYLTADHFEIFQEVMEQEGVATVSC